MIDYWIIFELMSNHEMLHPKSVYFHKDGNGKLIAGPIWDFDFETLGRAPADRVDQLRQRRFFARMDAVGQAQLVECAAATRCDAACRCAQPLGAMVSVPAKRPGVHPAATRVDRPQPSHATTDDGPSYRRETKTATSHLLSIRPLSASNPYIGSGSNGSTGKFRPGKQATLRKKRNFIQKIIHEIPDTASVLSVVVLALSRERETTYLPLLQR